MRNGALLHKTTRVIDAKSRATVAMSILKKSCLAALALLCIATFPLAGVAAEPMPDYEQRGQPVDENDLRILDGAMALLADESHWNRHDTRECETNATTLSLFCALQKASIEVLGKYDHRRVGLQEVRFAIEEVSGGREFEHRLMDFNNLPETSISDIRKVLAIARSRVAERLKPAKP
jgi:hypothetical protein